MARARLRLKIGCFYVYRANGSAIRPETCPLAGQPQAVSSSGYMSSQQRIGGFTLVEIAVILLIIGALAAIAAPSFVSWLNAKKVERAIIEVDNALQESQAEAVKRSRTCQLTIPQGTDPTVTGDCLVTGDRILKDVTLSYNQPAPWTINFDFKGRNSDVADTGTIVISSSLSAVPQKCIVISYGIGLRRLGTYDGTNCLP